MVEELFNNLRTSKEVSVVDCFSAGMYCSYENWKIEKRTL